MLLLNDSPGRSACATTSSLQKPAQIKRALVIAAASIVIATSLFNYIIHYMLPARGIVGLFI